jgi:hypothetical protein
LPKPGQSLEKRRLAFRNEDIENRKFGKSKYRDVRRSRHDDVHLSYELQYIPLFFFGHRLNIIEGDFRKTAAP